MVAAGGREELRDTAGTPKNAAPYAQHEGRALIYLARFAMLPSEAP
jgi:hypothetical protein